MKTPPKKQFFKSILIVSAFGAGIFALNFRYNLLKSVTETHPAKKTLPGSKERALDSKQGSRPTQDWKSPQNFERILENISNITSDTSSRDHYQIFLELREAIYHNPNKIDLLRDFSLFEEPKTEAEKKQISLIYGALAQSGRAEAWDIIRDGLEEGSGEFVGFQAVAAATDLGVLTPIEAYDTLLGVFTNHKVEYIRNSALLALGALSRSQPEFAKRFGPVVEDRLTKQNLETPWDQIDVTLAAAGNHGDPRYVEPIKKFYHHPDDTIRGRVLFALRQIPDPEVILWIGSQAAKDLSPKVQIEGLKALAEMEAAAEKNPHIGEALDQSIGQITISGQSLEVASTGVRFLSHALHNKRATTLAALEAIRSQSKNPLLKAAIADHLAQTVP